MFVKKIRREKIRLRPATIDDNQPLWHIRNDPETRKNSVNPNFLPYREYREWLKIALASSYYHILVIENLRGRIIGKIRFSINNDKTAEIAIALTEENRGKGYGTTALLSALKIAHQELGLSRVYAFIKPENTASLRAFEKAGFKNSGEISYQGIPCLKMIKTIHRE